mmetsp:Transcript_50914/g.74572  ORF Transcript_50914/g.74572 Transcript_50914/m.74572 type:complete len:141 (+) Transcript_50914:320-742(+)
MDIQSATWGVKSNVKEELTHIMDTFTTVRPQVDAQMRDKDDYKRKFDKEKVPFDWTLVARIHQGAVGLAKYAMTMMLTSIQGVDPHPDLLSLMEQALRFAFKCHQFAGGFDPESTQAFVSLSTSLQSMQDAQYESRSHDA